MYAIEFQTRVRNGSIRIPEEHQGKFKGQVRVIVLAEESAENFDMIEHLLMNPLQLKDFSPLTREEIYERT